MCLTDKDLQIEPPDVDGTGDDGSPDELEAGSIVSVLLASDESTLPGMMTAINSIYQNTNHRVRFYIFTNQQTLNHLR